jgi:hypothetical protein
VRLSSDRRFDEKESGILPRRTLHRACHPWPAGGVLSGQSLIRAAELRAVGTEYSRYVTSIQTFRDKYFAIPGDMTNATAFWGFAGSTNCTNSSGTATTSPGTCDGNGDGRLQTAAAASQTGEFTQFWRQLALTGLIEGTYTGNSGSGSTQHCALGTNCPRSKLGNAGWGAGYWLNTNTSDTYNFAYDYGNNLRFGTEFAISTPGGAALKPEEAWNIDTKLDDGRPGSGRIVPNWQNCTTAVDAANVDASYALTTSVAQCCLWFAKAY